MKNEAENKIQIKAYSIKELASVYEVSEKIIRQWLTPFESEIGTKIGWYYTPKQAEIIFTKLGIPQIMYLT
jgi:intergrase/recombinase